MSYAPRPLPSTGCDPSAGEQQPSCNTVTGADQYSWCAVHTFEYTPCMSEYERDAWQDFKKQHPRRHIAQQKKDAPVKPAAPCLIAGADVVL